MFFSALASSWSLRLYQVVSSSINKIKLFFVQFFNWGVWCWLEYATVGYLAKRIQMRKNHFAALQRMAIQLQTAREEHFSQFRVKYILSSLLGCSIQSHSGQIHIGKASIPLHGKTKNFVKSQYKILQKIKSDKFWIFCPFDFCQRLVFLRSCVKQRLLRCFKREMVFCCSLRILVHIRPVV